MKYLIYLSVVIFAVSCKMPASGQAVSEVVNAQQFEQKIAEFENAGTAYQLIDVRTPEEYGEGNIKGAVNINFYDAGFQAEIEKLNKDIPTLVYCRSGKRSGNTREMMKQMGFTEVYDLSGGIVAWSAAHPTE